MKLAKVRLDDGSKRIAMVSDGDVQLLDMTQVENIHSLSDILHAPDPVGLAKFLLDTSAAPLPFEEVAFLPPVDRQDVWAAGVTYKRSQVARMEESESGASHYDKVYSADRPELFYKADAARVVGDGQPVRVRFDSEWTVPEPELTLMLSPEGAICGYTIGNDMSARDIEGENPLYLPQAKVYKQSCAMGPWVLLADKPLPKAETSIVLTVKRRGEEVFRDETGIDQLNRELADLAAWLYRENDFPYGAALLTGTGIIPPDDFSLEDGDEVAIAIAGIGTLTNPVAKGAAG